MSSPRRQRREIRDNLSNRGHNRRHGDDNRLENGQIRPKFRQNLPAAGWYVADFGTNVAKLTRISSI
jgi:hypothetical protein